MRPASGSGGLKTRLAAGPDETIEEMSPTPPNLQRRRPPHPATVVQPKPAFDRVAARPPHPATVAQPKPVFGGMAKRPPHPATVVQRAVAGHGAVVQRMFDEELMSGLAEATEDDTPPDYDYDEFWLKLKNVKLKQEIKQISFEVKLMTNFTTGKLLVSARREGDQAFVLEQSSQTEKKRQIFWLPWLHGKVASAPRSDYEDSDSGCDYFFTATLDGCTFVLTESSVLHVAADYKPGVDHAVSGQSEVARHAPLKYQKGDTKRRGIVFGQREGSNWGYYFCSGHFAKNCEKIVLVRIVEEYPYGSPGHFTLM